MPHATATDERSEKVFDRPAECSCGLTGAFGAIRVHLRDSTQHRMIFIGSRLEELQADFRQAGIAWAMIDEHAQDTARKLADAEEALSAIRASDDEASDNEAYAVRQSMDRAHAALRAALMIEGTRAEALYAATRAMWAEMKDGDA